MKLNKQELEIIAQSIIDNINATRVELSQDEAKKLRPQYTEFFNQFEKGLEKASKIANESLEEFKSNLLSIGFKEEIFKSIYLRSYSFHLDFKNNYLNPKKHEFYDTFVNTVSRCTNNKKTIPSINQIKSDLIMTNLFEDGFDIDALINKISSKYI